MRAIDSVLQGIDSVLQGIDSVLQAVDSVLQGMCCPAELTEHSTYCRALTEL